MHNQSLYSPPILHYAIQQSPNSQNIAEQAKPKFFEAYSIKNYFLTVRGPRIESNKDNPWYIEPAYHHEHKKSSYHGDFPT